MTGPVQLALIDRAYMQPLDRSTQVTRFPPTDAPCDCRKNEDCRYPFCRPDTSRGLGSAGPMVPVADRKRPGASALAFCMPDEGDKDERNDP